MQLVDSLSLHYTGPVTRRFGLTMPSRFSAHKELGEVRENRDLKFIGFGVSTFRVCRLIVKYLDSKY